MEISNQFNWRKLGVRTQQLFPHFVEHLKYHTDLSHGFHFLHHDGIRGNRELSYIFQIPNCKLRHLFAGHWRQFCTSAL